MMKLRSAKPRSAVIAAKARAEADRKWRAVLRDLESKHRKEIADFQTIYCKLREDYNRLSDRRRILEDRLRHPLRELARSISKALPVTRRKGEY